MKGKRLPALLPALLLTIMAGCGPKGPDTAVYAPAEGERLVIYTSHKEEVYQPIVKEFEQRTGIWVDVVAGGTNELLERIQKEADSPAADVMFGGGVESLASYRDCFAPYTCAEAEEIQDRFRDPEDLWTPFSALPVVLVYNTKLVRPGQVGRWSDLFSSQLRGRIAFADPAVSGSSFTALATLLQAVSGEDERLLQGLAENLGGRQLEGSGEVVQSVAGGTDLVGVTLEETALKRIAAGDNIALVYPEEGSSCVPDASALIRGAAHSENARLFLDFTASREVQQLLTEEFCRRPVRRDVETTGQMTPLAEIPMAAYDVEWASGHRDALLMTWAFYLGEGGEA